MTIEVISFDLDDTLWAVKPVIIAAQDAMNQHIHEQVPEYSSLIDDAQMGALRDNRLAAEPTLRYDISRLRLVLLTDALLHCGLDEPSARALAASAFETFMRGRNRVSFFDGVLETLTQLKSRYRLIGLTNGNADFREAGLGDLFELSVSPVEAQARKPEAGIFAAALRAADTTPDRVVHVGDNLQEDIAGATAAGWRSVWANRDAKPHEPTYGYSAVIEDLRELPAVLDRLSGTAA